MVIDDKVWTFENKTMNCNMQFMVIFYGISQNKKTEQKHETVFFCSFDGIFFHSQMFNTEFYAESRTFHFMFDDSVEIEIASGYFQRVLEDEIDFCWNNS